MTSDEDRSREQGLERQQTIWTGLYGPSRADELTGELRRRWAAEPRRSLAELVAEVDPDDDDDWETGGLSRPGVG